MDNVYFLKKCYFDENKTKNTDPVKCCICLRPTSYTIDLLPKNGYDFHDTIGLCEKCFCGGEND